MCHYVRVVELFLTLFGKPGSCTSKGRRAADQSQSDSWLMPGAVAMATARRWGCCGFLGFLGQEKRASKLLRGLRETAGGSLTLTAQCTLQVHVRI